MLKYVDAAIHMPNNIETVKFLTTMTDSDYESFLNLSPFPPFSEEVITYLNSLSKLLNKDPRVRQYPDVATFSFFCRKANIVQLKRMFLKDGALILGRGIVFHIAPSNVPVNFAYSLIAGLLSGNSNIVRVPSKNFEQVKIIVDAINTLSHKSEHANITNRIILVKYDRSSEATERFSLVCDVRIIWGGDETIHQIRTNPLPPRAFDITFADRYSICAINADSYINEMLPEKISVGFYNDTYLFDQNACTSPHLIFWLGNKENVRKSQMIFWDSLYKIVSEKYQVQAVTAVDKITSFYSQAIMGSNLSLEQKKDNLLYRIKLGELTEDIDQFRCHSGYFSEYHASSLLELSTVINRKYQTLSYYGFSKKDISGFIKLARPVGIDRIVPIGKTMDFSLNWDGYNLVDSLSRVIEIF
ncbi:MAG: acyl-CoA reductase [Mariniphaga sp.]|nr:acyl-CoA reductase [Mariniphaga sp.]